jgi:hypothetical protein
MGLVPIGQNVCPAGLGDWTNIDTFPQGFPVLAGTCSSWGRGRRFSFPGRGDRVEQQMRCDAMPPGRASALLYQGEGGQTEDPSLLLLLLLVTGSQTPRLPDSQTPRLPDSQLSFLLHLHLHHQSVSQSVSQSCLASASRPGGFARWCRLITLHH